MPYDSNVYWHEVSNELFDEVHMLRNGIEILESISVRNHCDSETIRAINVYIRSLARFDRSQKAKSAAKWRAKQ